MTSLLRLRQELTKLIQRHTNNIADMVSKAKAQFAIYESLLQGLNVSNIASLSVC